MVRLNNLSIKAWSNLSKNTWITQKLLGWADKTNLAQYPNFLIKHKNMKDETKHKIIELLTQKNQLVFNPGSTSNTTRIAALQTERQFVSASELVSDNSVNLLLTELPLFDFKNARHTYENHLRQIVQTIIQNLSTLAPKAYVAIISSDQRYKNRYYCCHADLIEHLKTTPLTLQGLINVIQDSYALKAYGYPSTYVPNIINQFVTIFRC